MPSVFHKFAAVRTIVGHEESERAHLSDQRGIGRIADADVLEQLGAAASIRRVSSVSTQSRRVTAERR